MRRSAVVVLALVLLGACSGDDEGSDRTQGCDAAKNFIETVAVEMDTSSLEAMERWSADTKAAQERIADEAPEDVREAMRAYIDSDPESISVDEQQAKDDGFAKVVAWVVNDCGYALPDQ